MMYPIFQTPYPWFCFCFLVRYEKIKFLVIALKNAVEVYAWAPKPYHKFMAFKVGNKINEMQYKIRHTEDISSSVCGAAGMSVQCMLNTWSTSNIMESTTY